MPPKRSSTEIDFTIIKEGCLIKSPPSYLFIKRASWKGRFFKLCKTAVGSYFIRYYAYDGVSLDYKGEIPVSDIKSIELGTNAMDKNMTTITNLFNNSPQNVLCIKTNKRVFYLLDENEENIKNWQKCITDVWVKINQTENVDGPQIKHTVLVAPPPELPQIPDLETGKKDKEPIGSFTDEKHVDKRKEQSDIEDETTRPKSYPVDHPFSCPPVLDDRQRSYTDPNSRKEIPDCKPLNLLMTLPKLTVERKRSHTCTEARIPLKNEFRRLSLSEQQETSSVDTAYYSDTEIYDVPRAGLNRISQDFTEEEEEEEEERFDSPDENVYMCMDQIPSPQDSFEDSETNFGDSTDQTQNPLDEQKSLCSEEQNNHCPPKPPRNSRTIEPDRSPKPQGSQLKRAYILKMVFEHDSSEFVKMYLTIPTAHLRNYFDLQEVGERLCVSKWKGPVEIGCVFHHGDHINEINGFRPESKDFFFQMLNLFTRDEVNLVVTRNMKAGVFHLEGCNCGTS